MKQSNIRSAFKALSVLILSLALLALSVGCKNPDSDRELEIFLNEDGGFKVLQFADLHFGKEGTMYHNSDVERTLNFIDFAINAESPDFIVLMGDNMMSQGVRGAKFIVETFDKYKIPYTFVFGNHDAELHVPTLSKHDVAKYLERCDSPYLKFKSGFVQTGRENRYGNFSILLKNKTTNALVGAFVVIDTGVYDYDLDKYQTITTEQIAWYEGEIARLDGLYSAQEENPLDVVPTITYGHIQLPQYNIAYQKAANGDGAEFIYGQKPTWYEANDGANYGTEPEYDFYAAMKKMGSAKAYLCGHMHRLLYHVKMDGIILGFCPQAGVLDNQQRPITTFSYTLDEGFEMALNLVTEPSAQ